MRTGISSLIIWDWDHQFISDKKTDPSHISDCDTGLHVFSASKALHASRITEAATHIPFRYWYLSGHKSMTIMMAHMAYIQLIRLDIHSHLSSSSFPSVQVGAVMPRRPTSLMPPRGGTWPPASPRRRAPLRGPSTSGHPPPPLLPARMAPSTTTPIETSSYRRCCPVGEGAAMMKTEEEVREGPRGGLIPPRGGGHRGSSLLPVGLEASLQRPRLRRMESLRSC